LVTGLVTGRVLQFDHACGYGFVAADDGGDDVFLRTSVFDGDPDELVRGTKPEFKVMAGDRGRLTELLLGNVSSLTGAQVLQARRIALESAKKYGWVDM
jgi:cold shock CspA family protein